MQVRAIAKFVRMSPRKVRLVTGLLRGLKLDAARARMAFLPKAAALPVLKVLNSAAANAVNNFKLDEESLTVFAATADQGPTLKRWRARAMGSAAPILKRTSHITVILTDGKDQPRTETAKPQKDDKKGQKPAEEKKAEPVKVEKKEEKKPVKEKAPRKPAAKKAAAK